MRPPGSYGSSDASAGYRTWSRSPIHREGGNRGGRSHLKCGSGPVGCREPRFRILDRVDHERPLLADERQARGTGPFGRAIDEMLGQRSEEHTSELQSLMRISYAVFCLKKKKKSHT